MTRDDIIRLAWEAKVLPAVIGNTTGHFAYIERFAALVAASEREACAQECDALEQRKWESLVGQGGRIAFAGPVQCAAATRARGES